MRENTNASVHAKYSALVNVLHVLSIDGTDIAWIYLKKCSINVFMCVNICLIYGTVHKCTYSV